ncbi:MAG TPA: hypothetical protein VGH28_28680 [Polyangiaceae bacterium]|jgi:hypothetical protein
MLIGRRLGALAFLTVASAAHATPCTAAFATASQRAVEGRLVEAREALIACSSESCPPAMRPICTANLVKLEARVPSIVVAAVGEDGTDVVGATLAIDGKSAGAVDGKAREVDPGPHAIRVQAGDASATVSIVAREGERDRVVRVVMARPLRATPPVASSRRPVPASVWITSGVALVSAGIWAGFGITGLAKKSDLDACKGHCAPSDVASTVTAFNVADVAGAIAVVALAVDLILFWTRPAVTQPSRGESMGARWFF